MNHKTTLARLAYATCAVALAACGGGSENQASADLKSSASLTPVTAPSPATAPAAVPAASPAAAPASAPAAAAPAVASSTPEVAASPAAQAAIPIDTQAAMNAPQAVEPVHLSGNTAPSASPSAPPRFSTSAIVNGAEGLVVALQTDASVMTTALQYPLGVFYGLSGTTTQRVQVTDAACTRGGTFSATSNKAAARAGFATYDRVEIVFKNCAMEDDSSINGSFTVINSADLQFQGFQDFKVNAIVVFNSTVTLTQTGRTTVMAGTLDTYLWLNPDRLAISYTTRRDGFLASGSTVQMQYREFSNLRVSPSPSSRMPASTRPNGRIIAFFPGHNTIMDVRTPKPLAGTEDSLGFITPTSGEVRGTSVVPELPSVAVEVTGSNTATVFGDSNNTGVYDVQVPSSWRALWVR